MCQYVCHASIITTSRCPEPQFPRKDKFKITKACQCRSWWFIEPGISAPSTVIENQRYWIQLLVTTNQLWLVVVPAIWTIRARSATSRKEIIDCVIKRRFLLGLWASNVCLRAEIKLIFKQELMQSLFIFLKSETGVGIRTKTNGHCFPSWWL